MQYNKYTTIKSSGKKIAPEFQIETYKERA